MALTTPKPNFATWLRSEMRGQGIGVRTLARRMVKQDRRSLDYHREVEGARRGIYRWLNGVRPSAESRAAVADALGVPREQVPSDGDEESD